MHDILYMYSVMLNRICTVLYPTPRAFANSLFRR